MYSTLYKCNVDRTGKSILEKVLFAILIYIIIKMLYQENTTIMFYQTTIIISYYVLQGEQEGMKKTDDYYENKIK